MTGRASIHATAVIIGEAGVLIRGPSGAGKSALALALIAAAARAGRFARLVGDDRVRLSVNHGRLIARGHPAVAGRIERRGQGVEATAHEGAAVVRLVVDLIAAAVSARLPAEEELRQDILGLEIPRMTLISGISAQDQAESALARLQQPAL
jgi:serine kinase of HPr protein (carbohydrate metabolism regulator)